MKQKIQNAIDKAIDSANKKVGAEVFLKAGYNIQIKKIIQKVKK